MGGRTGSQQLNRGGRQSQAGHRAQANSSPHSHQNAGALQYFLHPKGVLERHEEMPCLSDSNIPKPTCLVSNLIILPGVPWLGREGRETALDTIRVELASP